MSVTAFENTTTSDTNNRIIRQHQRGMMWIYNNNSLSSSSCSETAAGDNDHHDSSSSSSSIGNNSDSSAGADDDDAEVQSRNETTALSCAALEHALPVKRGISTFYAGKSKSYTSLSDVVSVPSIHDIVKPQDAYNRKRKNILAHSLLFHNPSHPHPYPTFTSNTNRISNRSETSTLNSSHPPSRPPLPATPPPTNHSSYSSSPRIYSSPCQSFSLSVLQHAFASATTSTSLRNKTVEADRSSLCCFLHTCFRYDNFVKCYTCNWFLVSRFLLLPIVYTSFWAFKEFSGCSIETTLKIKTMQWLMAMNLR